MSSEFLFVFVKYAFCHSNVQKQKTTNMSIATLCFAMLYNLCYAVPLYMCPNSGLMDRVLLYTDMHFLVTQKA